MPATGPCRAEPNSSSQPRKAGPVDDAAAKAARDFLLGNDLAAQLSAGEAGTGGASTAGAKLLEVRRALK